MRRLCLQMSAAGYGSLEYLIALPVDELMEVVEEVNRIVKEQRIRTGNKNRGGS